MKNLLITTCFAVSTLLVNAQDIHFSQYFAAPLMLNPATTGAINGDFRVAAIYRNQFFSEFNNPYATYATYGGSFDAALLRKRLDLDQLGVGLMVYNDKAGTGSLITTTVMASIAYHKVLDRYNKHSLSFGIQGGISQKRIDFSKLTFEQQFNPILENFDPTAGNGESGTKSSILYPNFSAGLLWKSRLGKRLSIYAGFTYANAFQPKESFLKNSTNSLNSRFVLHGGLDISLSKYITLTPGFLYQKQNSAQEASAGVALGLQINDINSIYFGTWYRIGDAVIPMVAYEYHDVRVGLSFDATTSNLRTANSSKGAVELSLVYIYNNKPPRDFSSVKFCPRF